MSDASCTLGSFCRGAGILIGRGVGHTAKLFGAILFAAILVSASFGALYLLLVGNFQLMRNPLVLAEGLHATAWGGLLLSLTLGGVFTLSVLKEHRGMLSRDERHGVTVLLGLWTWLSVTQWLLASVFSAAEMMDGAPLTVMRGLHVFTLGLLGISALVFGILMPGIRAVCDTGQR